MDIEEMIATVSNADEETNSTPLMKLLADQYRKGADLRTLTPLLKHRSPRVVELAAWITSEVVSANRGREIFNEISSLLDNSEPVIKFWAIASVSKSVMPNDKSVIRKLFSLAADSNSGVRRQALYWLCLIPNSIVCSIAELDSEHILHLLINGDKNGILQAINSNELLERKMGIIAAVRRFGIHGEFIQELLPLLNDEEKSCLKRLSISSKYICHST